MSPGYNLQSSAAPSAPALMPPPLESLRSREPCTVSHVLSLHAQEASVSPGLLPSVMPLPHLAVSPDRSSPD